MEKNQTISTNTTNPASEPTHEVLLVMNDNSLVLKCIKIIENTKFIYSSEFTPKNISQFCVGNFSNFCKLCRDIFEGTDNTNHTVVYNQFDDSLVMNIVYASVFEFRFDIVLQFVSKETMQVDLMSPITKDVNNLKTALGTVIIEMKNLSSELSAIKQKDKILPTNDITGDKILSVLSEIRELKSVFGLMCTDIKNLEKFVYTELNEIRVVENDSNEKISTNCKNLSINFNDCMCCTINKFAPYGGETIYTISTDPKLKFTENFKLVKCKELTITINTSVEGVKLSSLPACTETLIIQSNLESTNFLLFAVSELPNLKIFHMKNITRSSNFDLAIQKLNPPVIYVTESDIFLKENNLMNYGYQFKDEIKADQYKPSNTFIYVKNIKL